jgi:putative DNA methylase
LEYRREDRCPRLIEVALPIGEISAESVRDKSLRHGHVSTLHLWWARRPLATSRAVVFASLIPDPDDPKCPPEFARSVEDFLKRKVPSKLRSYMRKHEEISDPDPFRPYDGVPDTLRNRLLMFIAKWSRETLAFEKGKADKPPKPEFLLDDRCLVKWETSDHSSSQGQEVLRVARELIKVAHQGRAPVVLDPFAGGGSIPLEAARLGCQAIANDYNPVAYLVLRATCEFPQRYGKPGRRQIKTDALGKRDAREVEVPNVLVHDIEIWANRILNKAASKIAHLYPPGKDKRVVVAYLWARTVPCSNPSCRAEFPLLRSLVICNKPDKQVALTMEVAKQDKKIRFGIVHGHAIKRREGTKPRPKGPAICPFCQQQTSEEELRSAGRNKRMGERMVAVIVTGPNGKDYRAVEESDIAAFRKASPHEADRPSERIEGGNKYMGPPLYGLTKWGSLFNSRQLLSMQTFASCLTEALKEMSVEIEDAEYRKAVAVYLALWISRIAQRGSNVGIWHTSRETLEHPFGRQAIPMTWDYPEANPFSGSTGGSEGGIDWMTRVVEHESSSVSPASVLCSDGSGLRFAPGSVDAVVTDPPYFDAIAYSDLSDYFYVWLKRVLSDIFPEQFTTPLTPKSDEATAFKHRHGGDEEKADSHFRAKLAQTLSRSRHALGSEGVVSIMFAHQSNKAWAGLVNAVFDAGLTVDATWPIDTELTTALKASISALSSSFTVACRSRVAGTGAAFKDVREEIKRVVKDAVSRFWDYGFRGADLLVACYGPAVGVFGKYERVEKADGTLVEIPELLELARSAAREAISGEFRGDNISALYYLWANLYGVTEQKWDDARTLVQIGGDGEDAVEIAKGAGVLIVEGPICHLALLADRTKRRGLGTEAVPHLIDCLHRAMLLWKQEKRSELINYLTEHDLLSDDRFWKLAQSLFDVLPRDLEDWRLVAAILGERETLRTEGKKGVAMPSQRTLGLR